MKKQYPKIIITLIIFLAHIFLIGYTTYAVSPQGEEVVQTISATTIDQVIGDADQFIEEGEDSTTINEQQLKDTKNFLYNLFLGIGIIVVVIVGMVLGVKYMIGSLEEKAEYKELLVGYLIGCVVLFGAFGIWKLVVNILGTLG